MSWTQILNFPFMQHALIAILFAGITFPMIGVFILSLNLIPLRFAMMHVALLGGAIGLFLKVDPLLLGLLFCILSSMALGPVSEKMKLGVGILSGYFMTLTLALAFILIYKADIHVLEAFIDLRINNAIVRVKKGEDWTAEYIPAKETEKQPGGRFRLPVRPSTRPEYLDGRWPKCS